MLKEASEIPTRYSFLEKVYIVYEIVEGKNKILAGDFLDIKDVPRYNNKVIFSRIPIKC